MGITLNPSTLLNGTGLDVTSLVSEIVSNQSGQMQQWQNQLSDLANQSGILSGINTELSSLQTAVQALTDPTGALAAQSATSSDSGILTAISDTSAVAGTHQIVVQNLATNGTVYTQAMADGDTSFLASGAGTGDIKLQIGGSTGTTRDISITKGSNDTLSTLASYINQQNWGVTANVVTDSTGARLAIYSQSTGSAGALAITSNNTSLVFENPVGGTNANFQIDGVPFSSQSNAVSGSIPGVTLDLAGADPNTTVQLTIGQDTGQVSQAVNNFISAYNSVIQAINQQFAVDPTTNSEGPLGSDSSLRSLQSSLLADVTYALTGSAGGANSGITNLAALGVNMNDDGTLSLGTNAAGQSLTQILQSNPSAVVDFFQNSSVTGFADNFQKDLSTLTNPSYGVLTADISQNQLEQSSLTDDINNFQTNLTAEQTQLTNELNQVNATLQTFPATLTEITTLLGLTSNNSTSSSGS